MSQTPSPPNNRDAERSVIGGVLRDPEILPDLLAVMRADSFYFDAHRRIFGAIIDLAARGAPVDLVTLYDILRKSRQLEDVGGKDYLAELWEATASGANALYHANLVRDAALLRSLIHTSNETLRDAYAPTMPAEELVARTERKLFALGAESFSGTEPHRASELVPEALARIDRIASGEEPPGLPTGFAEIDHVMGPMNPEQFIVLAARPSIGKTALALGIATGATRAGVPTLFVSLEMSRRQILERILAMRSGVPLRAIQQATLTAEQADRVDTAGKQFATEPFHLEDTTPMTAARLASMVRSGVRRDGLKLVVVDYLGLMEPEDLKAPKVYQIGTLSRRLKQLAHACGIPIVVLAQLNRESENRTDGKPKLSDLRDSGEVEQDADVAILLSRQKDQSDDNEVWYIDADVAKNRNGATGLVTLAYRRAVVRFENAAIGN